MQIARAALPGQIVLMTLLALLAGSSYLVDGELPDAMPLHTVLSVLTTVGCFSYFVRRSRREAFNLFVCGFFALLPLAAVQAHLLAFHAWQGLPLAQFAVSRAGHAAVYIACAALVAEGTSLASPPSLGETSPPRHAAFLRTISAVTVVLACAWPLFRIHRLQSLDIVANMVAISSMILAAIRVYRSVNFPGVMNVCAFISILLTLTYGDESSIVTYPAYNGIYEVEAALRGAAQIGEARAHLAAATLSITSMSWLAISMEQILDARRSTCRLLGEFIMSLLSMAVAILVLTNRFDFIAEKNASSLSYDISVPLGRNQNAVAEWRAIGRRLRVGADDAEIRDLCSAYSGGGLGTSAVWIRPERNTTGDDIRRASQAMSRNGLEVLQFCGAASFDHDALRADDAEGVLAIDASRPFVSACILVRVQTPSDDLVDAPDTAALTCTNPRFSVVLDASVSAESVAWSAASCRDGAKVFLRSDEARARQRAPGG